MSGGQSQVYPVEPSAPPLAHYNTTPYPSYPEPTYETVDVTDVVTKQKEGSRPGQGFNEQPPPAYSRQPQGYSAVPQGGQASQAGVMNIEMHTQPPPPRQQTPQSNQADFGKSFSNKAIRHAFIKKVYLILMVQLLITVGIICLFLFVNPIKYWVQDNSWCYWMSYGIFFVTYLLLICIPSVRRNSPGNYICLIIFTLAMSYMTATISSFYDTSIVFIAIAITTGVCLAISLFAIQTKIDFTLCSGLLFALLMVLVMFGFACLFAYLIVGDNFTTYVMNVVYAGLAALVFSLFLVFDTQMVVGGKNRKYQLSPEEYITGALQLYLDIVYLLLAILGLSGAAAH